MKFGIRFADQIVGLVIILALASVAFAIVMLGQSQRWFAKDMDFHTFLSSAEGLSKNMPIQYKGFTIGNVKDFKLENDQVRVDFTIHEDYTGMVKQGSVVEMNGFLSFLGYSFLFHPGRGSQQLAEGTEIPIAGSARAVELARQGLTTLTPSEDSIAVLMNSVNALLAGLPPLLAGLTPILASLDPIVADLGEALGPGTDSTEIGKLIGGINTTLNMVEDVPQILDSTIEGVLATVLGELRPLLADVESLLATVSEPGGVFTMLGIDGEVISESLDSVPGLLSSLNDTMAPLPSQLPGLLTELRALLRSTDDVLVGLANNPLLRGGIPERPAIQTTGPRDIRF